MPVSTFVHRLSVLALVAVAAAGCSRQKYRERADKDVEALISQKNVFPQWEVKNWHVYPDQRARFADPFKPDAPPFPVDDYATQLVSPNPQKPGKGGVGRYEGDGYLHQIAAWNAQNRSEGNPDEPTTGDPAIPVPPKEDTPEEAEYKATFATNEQGYRMKLEQTVELALFNSREFQDRREDLYLAALPVSLERFGFSAQAFAAEELIFSAGGRATAAPGSRWSPSTSFGFSQRLASGAQLLVQLANQVVVNVGNGRPTVGISDFALSLSQPFLRGGGFAVTLEALTQAERTLLYAVRSYARFRNLFYYAIAGGGGYTNNPYGLQGLAANLGRGVGANLTANSVGYLPTVLRAAVLANEKKNVQAIESFLGLFQNLKEGNAVPELQVIQVEQRLVQSRGVVLRRTQEYVDNIDNFKLQLGVPATLPIELDEAPLRPIRRQLQRFEGVYQDLQDLEKAASVFDPTEPVPAYRQRWAKLLTESLLAKGTPFAQGYPAASEALRKLTPAELTARVAAMDAKRLQLLDERATRLSNNQPQPEEADREILATENARDAAQFEQSLREYEAQAWLRSPEAKQIDERKAAFRKAFDAGMLMAVAARAQRIEAIRGEWPALPGVPVADIDLLTAPLDLAYVRTAETVLNNRYDVMNARALVVDSWRRVNVVANSLRGVLDVEYDLAMASPTGSNQPFNLGGSRTLHQVRLRLEPPFVRRAERNNYRAALISYQRQRRSLQSVEDNVVTDARSDLRALRQLAQTFKIQQKAVELAYIVVDNARSTFTAPADPQARDTAGSSAALTQQLLSAQQQLVQAQNDLYTIWVNYLTTRMELFLDLELFTIDDRGVWTDDSTRPAPDIRPAPGGSPAPLPAPSGVGVDVVAPVAAGGIGLGDGPLPGSGVVPVAYVAPAGPGRPVPDTPTREPRWRPAR